MESNKDTLEPKPGAITDNKEALNFMDSVHSSPYPNLSFSGGNTNDHEIEFPFEGQSYLIPKHCRFFNKSALEISEFIPLDNQFDLITMDPPWWNKYIRRLNSVKQENGYKMLNNEDIRDLPIDQLLSAKGFVVIWCTNSPSHKEAIEKEFLPKWKLKLIGIWHWMKVTKSGEPICDFHRGTGKQPYELIFVAIREDMDIPEGFPENLMLVSVPSAVHSHKFPVFGKAKIIPQLTN